MKSKKSLRAQQKESTAGVSPRSNDPLDYTTFGELSEIITRNFDVFQSVLSNKQAVIRLMQDFANVRNPIAHCTVLDQVEQDRLKLMVETWFKVIMI